MIELLRRNTALRSLALGYAGAQLGMQIGWIAIVWWMLNSNYKARSTRRETNAASVNRGGV